MLFSISEMFVAVRQPGVLKTFAPNKRVSSIECPARPRSRLNAAVINLSEKDLSFCDELVNRPELFKSSSFFVLSNAFVEGPTRSSKPFGSWSPARSFSRVKRIRFLLAPNDDEMSEIRDRCAKAGILLFLGMPPRIPARETVRFCAKDREARLASSETATSLALGSGKN